MTSEIAGRWGRWAALPAPAHLVTDVLAAIRLTGWTVHRRGGFTQVVPPVPSRRLQGWKLHVSATVLSAPEVLAACVPLLVETGTAFGYAASVPILAELNDLHAPRETAGRFLTAYPRSDDAFRDLVKGLDEATAGLTGPTLHVGQPYRPGGLVHYRYGEFDGIEVLGNDGDYRRCVADPDGNLVEDAADPATAAPDWAALPFDAAPDRSRLSVAAGRAGVVFGGRYAVTRAVQHANKGGVYEARDLRTGAGVLLKQARPHVATDPDGRDARDLLGHEARLLRQLTPLGVVPRVLREFVQEDHLFLVEELLPGRSLRDVVSGSIADHTTALGYHELLRMLTRLARLVDAVHATGVVIRDLSPGNVILLPDGELRLIDLELAASRTGDPDQWCYLGVGGGTAGVSAPEQLRCAAPDVSADLFSLGAVALHLVTRTDPDLLADVPEVRSFVDRVDALLAPPLARRPVPAPLRQIITGLLRPEPADRLGLDGVLALCEVGLTDPDEELWRGDGDPGATVDLPRLADQHWRELLAGIVRQLGARLDVSATRPWPETAFGRNIEPCTVQHGIAGTVAVLARLVAEGAGHVDPDTADRAGRLLDNLLDRLLRHLDRDPHRLPGLYFGFAGTAWALCDAGRLLGRPYLVDRAVELALSLPVAWPNPGISHGVAGLGSCLLRLWEHTHLPAICERIVAIADHLLGTVEGGPGMSWSVDPSFDSTLAGHRSYGFAQGTAGIGAFLLAAGHLLGRRDLAGAARRCGDTLLDAARYDDDAALWPSGPDTADALAHWCDGSSGVGTFLCRLYARTGDLRYRDAAAAAARAVMRVRWSSRTGYCHGLAGDGDFLLDLARATGDDRYARWAEALAARIWALRVYRDGAALVPDESSQHITGGFGAGLTGHLAFLLRLRHAGPRLFHPDPEVPATFGSRPDLVFQPAAWCAGGPACRC